MNQKSYRMTARSPLGLLLITGTDKGVRSVQFTPKPLASQISSARFKKHVETIVRHLEGRQKRVDLPLDLKATDFQKSVWAELRRIPYAQTRSYQEVARAVGRPKAYRAVARACATNPVAIITPCHRVIAANGALSGYRWGVDRKKKLLAQEKQHA